ncbi:MAG: MBOAT family protein [Clostridiales bacterium]|nr:MBOAT family protein [Clostridiales bacterium]
MVFSSLIFIFAFLTTLVVLYFIVPKKFRMLVLFIYSFAFYGWGEPLFIIIMIISILSAYGLGFLIAKYREKDIKKARIYLAVSLCINLAFLIFFKYTNFFISNISAIPIFANLETLGWLKLPIGISFYTFQIMSYSIDLYCGDCRLQKSFIAFGTYVTLYPQLIAGPIVRYKDIDDQLTYREENRDKFAEGAGRFVAGIAKKILIADSMAAVVRYYNFSLDFQVTTLGAWLLIIAFTFQIYFDFSGYSDMAIGLGKMIGFEFLENFNYPYISKSITEFWRRWHISLSTWFKEYVYIPLGGNRKGFGKQIRNIAVVWLLTGFWHGASWNFLIWGGYFGVILILEKLFMLKVLSKIPSFFSHLYALFLVVIGWLIFYFTDLSAGFACFKAMFGIGVDAFATKTNLYDLLRFLPILVIGAVASTPYPKRLFDKAREKVAAFAYAVPVIMGCVLLICVAYMVNSTYSPFLYTRF